MISTRTLKLIDQYGYFGYSHKKGYFFLYKKNEPECIHSCRVEFAWDFKGYHKWIGFQCPNLDISLLNIFFGHIENQLKLKVKTVFYNSTIKNAVIIKVAPFWLKNETRRSLLTLFIRAGAVYYEGNFYKAINSYHLARKVKPAIRHFLKGYTVPSYRNLREDYDGYEGFVGHFRNRTPAQLKKLLVKP